MARILLVDDDDILREAIEANLLADGHTVHAAADGRSAFAAWQSSSFDLVISDIRMPEMDGVELVKAIRATSNMPIILITGFSDIMETHAAHDIGATEFMPKPFNRDDLNRAIQRCLHAAADASSGPQQFCKLSVNDFVSGRTIKFSIFVRLSPTKFVKLAHKGEDISLDRIRVYRDKGLHYLYLKREDFRQYVGFSLRLNEAAHKSESLSFEKKLNLLRHTGEVLHEQINHDGVDDAIYESAAAFVESAIDIVTDNVQTVEVLDSLRTNYDAVLVHGVGVSLYSVMLAQGMDWNRPANRFKVAMGGLLHDVGMKELGEDFATRPRYSWTLDEVKSFESHPHRGISILEGIDEIPGDVREIVKQHHENCLSMGFPSRMKSASIHPMAKLVAVADEFCDRIIRAPNGPGLSPIEAVRQVVSQCGDKLDKKVLDVLIKLIAEAAKKPAQGAP